MNQFKESKVFTICGSMKLWSQMVDIQSFYTTLGYIIQTPQKYLEKSYSPSKEYLDKLHEMKIGLSDGILVLSNGTIGESTKKEITYAQNLEKEIQYLFKKPEFKCRYLYEKKGKELCVHPLGSAVLPICYFKESLNDCQFSN